MGVSGLPWSPFSFSALNLGVFFRKCPDPTLGFIYFHVSFEVPRSQTHSCRLAAGGPDPNRIGAIFHGLGSHLLLPSLHLLRSFAAQSRAERTLRTASDLHIQRGLRMQPRLCSNIWIALACDIQANQLTSLTKAGPFALPGGVLELLGARPM